MGSELSMSLKIRILNVATLFFLLTIHLTADDLSLKNIRIADVVYNTDGKTSRNALEKTLEWDYARVFSTSYELNEYLQSQKQVLVNMKVFRSVLTEFRAVGKDGDLTLIRITVNLDEAWTIIPIPYYKYDNNLGFVMGLALDYKNVAGSLTDFSMSSYYSGVKSEVVLDWNSVRAGPLMLDFQYDQLWETVKTADSQGHVNLEYSFIQSSLQISMDVPLIYDISYISRPIVRWPYAYDFSINKTDRSNSAYMYDGPVPAYNHMLIWDNVDWIGSLRRGVSASVENQLEYDQVAGNFITWVDGVFKGFVYTPYVSYNTRVSAFFYYNDFKRNAADRLRGILDYKLSGTRGFFWNQDAPFNILSLPRIGDVQLSPFFDMGFVLPEGEHYRSGLMKYSTGGALILYPAILPSFSFLIDFGVNIKDLEETELRLTTLLYY